MAVTEYTHALIKEIVHAHIEADDAAHDELLRVIGLHIHEGSPGDEDHAGLVALLHEHIAATEGSHKRFASALDEHIRAWKFLVK
jgi:hypothetical protein